MLHHNIKDLHKHETRRERRMMKTLFHENLKPEDKRPPKGGWCPGDYVGMTCRVCGCQFSGDKRAYECAECAYANPSQNRPPSYWYCQTCDQKLDGEEVTPEELHDPVYGGCGFKVESRSGTPNRPPSCDLPPEHYGDLKPKACPVCGYCTPEVIAGRIDVQIECYCCKTRGPDRADYILATQSWNSIPRRSEVAELLRLVDEVVSWDEAIIDTHNFPEDGLAMAHDFKKLQAYAGKLRKETGE